MLSVKKYADCFYLKQNINCVIEFGEIAPTSHTAVHAVRHTAIQFKIKYVPFGSDRTH